jgi:hypothetical protein
MRPKIIAKKILKLTTIPKSTFFVHFMNDFFHTESMKEFCNLKKFEWSVFTRTPTENLEMRLKFAILSLLSQWIAYPRPYRFELLKARLNKLVKSCGIYINIPCEYLILPGPSGSSSALQSIFSIM